MDFLIMRAKMLFSIKTKWIAPPKSTKMVFDNYMQLSSLQFFIGTEITIKSSKDSGSLVLKDKTGTENAPLFSVVAEDPKNGEIVLQFLRLIRYVEKFVLKADETTNYEYSKNNSLFLIVRSLKNEDGTQKVNFLRVDQGFI